MGFPGRAPRLLFLNSGLGGLTVLRAARQAIPEAEIRFIADDACFSLWIERARPRSSRGC